MKLNIGPLAQIVGTKRVSPQGTVTGLREFAGKDVLVVVPTRTAEYRKTAEDLMVQARDEARRQGRHALRQVQQLRQRFLATSVPGTPQLLKLAPAEMRPAIKKADAWVRASARKLEKRAATYLQN